MATRIFSFGLLGCVLTFATESRAQDNTLTATFVITGTGAQPGEEVAVPFDVNSDSELQAFTISLDFDEEVLEGTAVEQRFSRRDGKDWSFWWSSIDNGNDTPGNGGVDEGFLTAAAIFDFDAVASVLPPPNRDNRILSLRFLVLPDAPVGSTELRFIDGGEPEDAGSPVLNVATLLLRPAAIMTDVSPLHIAGRLQIVAGRDVVFLRGDCNGDRNVNLTDAVCILDRLFTGGETGCRAALDTNGDSAAGIDDAVTLLNFLFAGGPPPAAPFPSCGSAGLDELACETPPASCPDVRAH